MDSALTDGINNKKRKLENSVSVPSAKHFCSETDRTRETVNDNEDDFSDDDLFSVEALSILSQSQKTQSQQESHSQYILSSRPFENKKAKVVNIKNNPPTATVQVLDTNGKEIDEFHEITICDGWIVKEGDFIYSPPEFSQVPVLHSDTLISCTSIAAATECPRRSILSDRFRDGEIGPGSWRMIMGNFLHQLFQDSLPKSIEKIKITSQYLKDEMIKIVYQNSLQVIQCEMSISKFLEGIKT